MKSLLLVAVLVFSFSTIHAAPDAAMQADNAAINSACTADSATAGCGADKVGTGLMKCLHAYKKANKGFKLSDACQAAMKQHHMDKKAGK